MRRALVLLLAALAVVSLPAGVAHADAFDDVFAQYRDSGRIDPCDFSAEDLQSARSQIPNDIEQYAPDFPQALDAALAARARGACKDGPATTAPAPAQTAVTPSPPADGGTTTPAPAASKPGAAPAPPAQAIPAAAVSADDAIPAAAASRTSSAGTPAALVLLAILGGLLLLGLLAWGAARWWAWEPRWLVGARHAAAEAGWRASAGWAEFTDWVRLGR